MKILKGLQQIAYKLSLIITLVLFCIVFFYALTDSKDMPFSSTINPLVRMLLIFSVAGFIFCIFHFYCKLLNRMNSVQNIIFVCSLFILMISLQIIFLSQMKVSLRYDALKVLDEAISVCKEGAVSPTRLDGYFSRYTNNYPILFLTVFILKTGKFLRIIDNTYSQAMLFVGMFNILFIDLGIFFIYRSLHHILNPKRGMQFLGLCFLFPVIYLWVPFYYTNTVSICFTSIVIYMFIKLYKMPSNTNIIKQLLYYFIFGIFITIDFKIRATGFITLMAIIIFVLLKSLGKKKNDGNLNQWNPSKQLNSSNPIRSIFFRIVLIFTIFVGIVFSFCSYKMIEHKYVPFDYTDTAFPSIHWISMGAAGTGEYSLQDELYTISQPTKKDKVQANLTQYKERLQKLGIPGYSKLMLSKLQLTFGNLTSGYSSELGVSTKYNNSNMYLLGCKSDLIALISQAEYLLFLVFSIIGLLSLLIQINPDYKKQNKISVKADTYQIPNENICISYIIYLNIAGAMLFQMIWEAGSIYSLSTILLCISGMLTGLDTAHKITPNIILNKLQNNKKWIPMFLISSFMIAMIYLYPKLTIDTYTSNDAVVNQYIYEWGDTKELTNDTVLTQTFLGNRQFNRISFQVRNLFGPENNAVYQVDLLEADGQTIHSYKIIAKTLGDYDFARIQINEIKPSSKRDIYQLTIKKIAGDDQNNLVFLSYQTGNYDAYPYGSLLNTNTTMNSLQTNAQSDLCFSVYETKNEPYIPNYIFWLISGLYILCNLVIALKLREIEVSSTASSIDVTG